MLQKIAKVTVRAQQQVLINSAYDLALRRGVLVWALTNIWFRKRKKTILLSRSTTQQNENCNLFMREEDIGCARFSRNEQGYR